MLKQLGVAPGDKVIVEQMGWPARDLGGKTIAKDFRGFGLLKQANGPRLTIEEINEAIAKGWAGEL